MIEHIGFQTRARTIDHLGREQIADAPTAISELWKNAYDAYARNAELHIYDGDPCVAAIVDDGHGMNREEFVNKWLVVGTDSKMNGTPTPEEDRDGLPVRSRQGQKGIGRLSAACLGPLMLIVSKRRYDRFVASLIDWRLFENPFLMLSDIIIPVVEFDEKDELIPLLEPMFDSMMCNVWGGGPAQDKERDSRIKAAWDEFSKLEAGKGKSTQESIASTLVKFAFKEIHFAEWPVWTGQSDRGTIMAISNIRFDLEAQLLRYEKDESSDILQARVQFNQSLWDFVDPFCETNVPQSGLDKKNDSFRTNIRVWDHKLPKDRFHIDEEFDLEWLHRLEHVVEGTIDNNGTFRGKIKAFGKWVENDYRIETPFKKPPRPDGSPGSFTIRIGSAELAKGLSNHTDEEFSRIQELAAIKSGFRIYRNNLRVLPYGREGSDFFRIELRRSKNFGRAFWSIRQMFGGVSISAEENQNLRDKAGREGFIDNQASKRFRDIIINILEITARKFFGTESSLREVELAPRIEAAKQRKLEEDRKKIKLRNRRLFRTSLESRLPQLDALAQRTSIILNSARNGELGSEQQSTQALSEVEECRRELQTLALTDPPKNLGSLEDDYKIFRARFRELKENLVLAGGSIENHLEKIAPKSHRDIAFSALQSHASHLQNRLRSWNQEAKSILESETQRISNLYEDRKKSYHAKTLPLLDQLESGSLSLSTTLDSLRDERELQDAENERLFGSYLSAIKLLKDQIDLDAALSNEVAKVDELREEAGRFHALAQLGVTVEIIGHEFESVSQTIHETLERFPNDVKNSKVFQIVKSNHEQLVERLRFLSPLKLSGPRNYESITGKRIFEYLEDFFKAARERNAIRLEATDSFLSFSVSEMPSRILPVFMNLVNNSIYWSSQNNEQKALIRLDLIDGAVLVSDNGPGVDEDDLKHLFQLFFTRKVRGGRGIGLYLCKTNLAQGGHMIEYAKVRSPEMLPGANFMIRFRGISND
jgi:signal transduction histidine kinase